MISSKELRLFSIFAIFSVILVFVGSNFLLPISSFFLLPHYILGLINLGIATYYYAFASFDFAYVQKRACGVSYGSAVLKKSGLLTKVSLGAQTLPIKTYTLNLKELPYSRHFLGRWTVYVAEDKHLELWQDNAIFGGQWYYISYS